PFDTYNDPLLFNSYNCPSQSSLFAPTPEYAPMPGYGICQTPSVLAEWEEGKLYDELLPICIYYLIVWKIILNNNKSI
ncbi:hypothetical protein N7493_010711, partial [Penicillium malachiteum]